MGSGEKATDILSGSGCQRTYDCRRESVHLDRAASVGALRRRLVLLPVSVLSVGGGAPSSSPPWLRSISSRVEAPHTLFEILQRRFISSPSFIDSIIYLKQHGLGLDFKLHSNTASPMLLKCGGQEGSFRGSRVLWTCLHHGGMMGLDCVLALASFLAPQDAPVSYSLPPFCN